MPQIIPEIGPGERLGTAFGTGLGTGMQALAALKLKKLVKQQEQADLAEGLKGVPGLDLTENEAQQYSKIPLPLLKSLVEQKMGAPGNIASWKMAARMTGMPEDEIERLIGGIAGSHYGMTKGGLKPQELIKIGQKKQQTDIAKQQNINNRLKPQLNEFQKEFRTAEEVLPALKSLAKLNKTGRVGAGIFGIQGREGQEFQSILDELAGMKIKGLPTPSHDISIRKNRIDQLIKKYEKKLRYKNIINDILEEHDNNLPANLFKLADERMNLGEKQHKKGSLAKDLSEREPERTIPFLETEPQVDSTPDIIRQDDYRQDDYRQPELLAGYSPEQLEAMLPSGVQREITPAPFSGPGLEDILDAASRIGGRGLAGVGGGIGGLLSVLPNIGSYLTGGKVPSYEEMQETLPILPPTTAQIRGKAEKYLGKEILEPQSRAERFLGTVAEEAGELLSPGMLLKPLVKGAQLIGKVPGWLKTTSNFLSIAPKAAVSITAAGNAAKEALDMAGAPKPVQEIGKAVTSLGAAIGTQYMARHQSRVLAKEITKDMKDLPSPLKETVTRKWEALKEVEESLKDPSLAKNLRGEVEEWKGILQGHLDTVLKKAPKIKKKYNDFKDLSKAYNVSSIIHDKTKKHLLSTRGMVGTTALLRAFGTSRPQVLAKGGGVVAAGIWGSGEIEKALRLLKISPTFEKKYGDILKAGLLATIQLTSKKAVEKEAQDNPVSG